MTTDHRDIAAERLTRLLLGLTHDLSFETQCEAMRDLIRAIPHASLTPSFIKWETKETARLKRSERTRKLFDQKQAQLPNL